MPCVATPPSCPSTTALFLPILLTQVLHALTLFATILLVPSAFFHGVSVSLTRQAPLVTLNSPALLQDCQIVTVNLPPQSNHHVLTRAARGSCIFARFLPFNSQRTSDLGMDNRTVEHRWRSWEEWSACLIAVDLWRLGTTSVCIVSF